MKILQIVFCVLSCLSLAACVLVFVYEGYWGFVCLGAAALFALLMFGAKKGFRRTPVRKKTDFMNTEEENNRIRTEEGRKQD